MITPLLVFTLLPLVSSVFFPELISSSGRPYCSEGLRAHGWLLFYYQVSVYVHSLEGNYISMFPNQ